MQSDERWTKTRRSGAFCAAALAVLVAVTGCENGNAADAAKKGGAPATKTADSHGKHAEELGEREHADVLKLSAEAVERYQVKSAPVEKHLLVPMIEVPAVVSLNAEKLAHVGSPVAGRVADVRVRLGDTVSKGDVLLVIQSAELGSVQGDYYQKRAAAEATVPVVELSKHSLDRAEALYKSQAISLAEVQKREIEYKTVVANFQTARSGEAAAAARLRLLGMDEQAIESLGKSGRIEPRYVLRAPLQGRVTERKVTLGELVDPQEESLLVVADMSTLWVMADVPEAKSGDVQLGAKARVTKSTGDGPGLTGAVSYISPAIEASTRTIQARIEVPGDGGLKPGMFVRAEIELTGESVEAVPVLAIPEEAIQTVEGQTVVFTPAEGEDGSFAKRVVRVGKPAGGLVQVLSGVKEGEQIVASGSFILKAELGKGGVDHDD